MKTLYLAAALLMASTAAHAGSGISLVIDGQKIHIDAPKNCSSLDCLKITGVNASKLNVKGFGSKKDDDDDTPAPVAPAPVPAPVASTVPVAPAAPIAAAPQPEQLAATTPAPLPPAPPDPVAAAPAFFAPAPAAAPAPVQVANSPLGVWATEEDKGNVRIEQCGANLCGYAVKSGERILINMRSEGSK